MSLTEQELNQLVGQNLKHYRERAGMTQLQVAEHLGVHPTTVTCYETGKNALKMGTFLMICELIEADPDRIVGHVRLHMAAAKQR